MMSVIVKPGPRQQMIESAVALMREQGVEGASFSRVLERSGAPRGSIYHHFPEGKAQLVEEATRYAGEFIAAGLAAALQSDDPVAAIRGFTASWERILEKWDYGAGCTVVAAALEGDRTPGAREAARDAFTSWQELLAGAFGEQGVPEERARSLAALTVAAVEGAVVLARAERSPEPLERVADELSTLVEEAVQAKKKTSPTTA
jgi:TetR/AcrR family transcriptional repressor of lmrAB and yxaGH operons